MKRSIRLAALLLAATTVMTPVCRAETSGILSDALTRYSKFEYTRALEILLPLAHRGDPVAEEILGFMYAKGNGVQQDNVLAHMWWSLAAAQGNEIARKNRDIVLKLMTPDQIAEAERLAREWKPLAER